MLFNLFGNLLHNAQPNAQLSTARDRLVREAAVTVVAIVLTFRGSRGRRRRASDTCRSASPATGTGSRSAKLEYKFHSYNAGKQLENPRVEFQIAGVGSPGTASSVYVIEIVQDGQVVVRTKRSFGDPNSTLTPHGSTPRTAASLKDVGLTDVIKAAIDEHVLHGG